MKYPLHFLNENPARGPGVPFQTEIDNQSSRDLEGKIIETLKNIYDPEIPVNIYDLGLIHRIVISKDNSIEIEMTLTTPGCPVAQTFPGMIQDSIEAIDGVEKTTLLLVWDPPWSIERLSEATKLQLGLL